MNLPVRRQSVLFVLLLAASSAAVLAQPTELQQDFNTWFNRVLAPETGDALADGLRIKYTIEYLHVPPPTELAALRREAIEHPDNPRLAELPNFERRLAKSPSETRHNCLWRLGNEWRWNTQTGDEKDGFTDRIWSNGVVWMLTDKTLVLMDPAKVSQSRYRVDRIPSSFSADCMNMFSAQLNAPPARRLNLVPQLNDDDVWSVQASSTDAGGAEYKVSARGHWNPTEHWGTIDESRWEEHGTDGKREGEIIRTDNWEYIPSLRLGMAHRVDIAALDGQPDKRMSVKDAIIFSAADFQALIRVPSSDGIDPARGQVKFTSVMDLQSAQPTIKGPQGEATAFSTPDETPERAWLRTLGWAIAAMIVTCLLLIKVRRK